MQYYLAPEDDQRMKRLSEEVRGRLEEMALIAARVAGIKLDPNAVRKFVPHTIAVTEADAGAGGSPPVVTKVEIFDATSEHPEMCVVIYSSGPAGLESPCGTPIA